jgi:tRNA(adenine34) deaminase
VYQQWYRGFESRPLRLSSPPPDPTHDAFMREALAEARAAEARGEVPVGCVIVVGDRIVGRGHNLRETSQDPTAHAELIALREAAAALGSWRLEDATLYVTLEPCPMCAGALVNARIARVVYGADDPKAGATTTLYAIGSDPRLNHRFALVPGVLAAECGALLSDFFARIRRDRRAARATATGLLPVAPPTEPDPDQDPDPA